jgi:hypothetical protein
MNSTPDAFVFFGALDWGLDAGPTQELAFLMF